MLITDFTTYDEVRSVLGINSDELEDNTIALPLYQRMLEVEINAINSGIITQYVTIAAITPASSRTTIQQALYDAVQLFAVYSTARQLGTSLPMFGPKEISDSKTLVARFTNDPYKVTLDKVETLYGRVRDNLQEAYANLSSSTLTSASRTYFSVASPSTDPVTG
jgi:hypothetical protein